MATFNFQIPLLSKGNRRFPSSSEQKFGEISKKNFEDININKEFHGRK